MTCLRHGFLELSARFLHVHLAAFPSSSPRPPPQVLGAPRPEKRPHALTTDWGDTRTDNYYWLRSDDRSSPEVLAHLKQEAAYTDAVCADILPLRDQVFKEMRGRIKEEDESAPQRHGAYYYYTRTEEGKQYKARILKTDRGLP